MGPFGGLNNTDSPIAIPANKAQDLLNVDVSPGGKSVKKREGYGLFSNLTITTSPVHGIYNFYDSNGNTVDIYFNDVYMAASVNGATPAVIISSGPSGATYQCVDSQGFAYCNNTLRTTLIKTNGATYSSIATVNSTGTLVAVTPERLVTSGFQEAANRIDFSAANNFTGWTIGSAGTAATQFTVVSPGSEITHIVYAFGRLIWFKDSSFGYVFIGQEEAQADWQVRIISPNVGTLDNTSVYWEGVLYFRGQDGHIYAYDGSNLTKLTRDIQGTIAASQPQITNSWSQTTTSDFQAGSIATDISTATSDSLIAKTTSYTISTSANDWGPSTLDNTVFVDTLTASGSLQTTFPENFTTVRDGSNGSRAVWVAQYCAGSGANCSISTTTLSSFVSSGQLTLTPASLSVSLVHTAERLNSINGGASYYFQINSFTKDPARSFYFMLSNRIPQHEGVLSPLPVPGQNYYWTVGLGTNTVGDGSVSNSCVGNLRNWNGLTYSLPAKVTIYISPTFYNVTINGVVSASNTVSSCQLTNPYAYFVTDQVGTGGSMSVSIDSFTVTPQTFTYTSQTYDTGISSPVWGPFSVSSSAPNGTLSFTSQSSNDGNTFDSAVSVSSNVVLTSNPKRYIKFNAAFSYSPVTLPGDVLSLSDYYFSSGSSGTFRSAVYNASNLRIWDTFLATRLDNGGTNTFYIRASNDSFTVNSATPSWTAITPGDTPTISTGSYIQARDDFYAPTGTNSVTMNDFTIKWLEGSGSDKSYAAYFNNAILFSVTAGTTTTNNNRILRLDLINTDWYLYDIGTNGMLIRNNSLYFGSSTEGKIFKFGDSDDDDGDAINAYWKSKDFVVGNPFVKKEFVNLSASVGSVENSSMTITYTIDGSSSTSYQFPLYAGQDYYKHFNKNLPLGKVGSVFNIKFGNNGADQPFETFAIQYGLRDKPWVPSQ